MAMSALTMTAMMPGRWPLDLSGRDHDIQSPATDVEAQQAQRILSYPPTTQESISATGACGRAVDSSQPRLVTPHPPLEETLQVPRSLISGIQSPQSQPTSPFPSSPGTGDELFFDCPSPSQSSMTGHETGSPSTSYLILEPVVEDETNLGTVDWRRYSPPQELLHSRDGTSHDLESIIAPSIERIQTRHIEEEERRAAASRVERPLARAGRASVRPRLQISMVDALVTTHLTPPSRLSATSETLSPNDTGYGSVSSGTERSRSPRSATRRSFGLGALFKRKDRTIVNLEEADEHQHPRPQSSEVWAVWPLPHTPLPLSLTREALNPASSTGECVSCLDDFDTGRLIKLTCHSYCRDCFQKLINNALENETHWPAKCCLSPIPIALVLPNLSVRSAKKYQQRQLEWSIPTGERIYCAQPTCSTWIAPKHINSATHSANCPECGHRACTTCRGPHHGEADCPQDLALQATINLAEMEGWKRCYSCHALVEHNRGCRHMTCRCKAQFCYICGLKWRTCACSDAQLATIQQQAERRRAEQDVRTARQRREEEEERAAIRAVEEFVRVEEERMARQVAEMQRREEEEIRRQERARIAAVNRRFRGLGTELLALHDMQRVLMAERYEFETEVLKKERQDALGALSIRHPTELQHLANQSTSKIVNTEAKYEAEYTVHVAEEQRVEDQYVDELRTFWKGKPDGEYKVREARDELRQEQDKEYRLWDAYRRRQIKAVREGEKRNMEALRVKQNTEVNAVDGRAQIDGLELRRQRWAEERWFVEVASERVVMLGEMEGREYAHAS